MVPYFATLQEIIDGEKCMSLCSILTQKLKMMEKRFYKKDHLWYVDLPDYIEAGLGTYNNLLMVDGADVFLDLVSHHGTEVWMKFDTLPFVNSQFTLISDAYGKNQALLDGVGHAPVAYGMYYTVPELQNHRLWLCPVTEYVFDGIYPERIWVSEVQS